MTSQEINHDLKNSTTKQMGEIMTEATDQSSIQLIETNSQLEVLVDAFLASAPAHSRGGEFRVGPIGPVKFELQFSGDVTLGVHTPVSLQGGSEKWAPSCVLNTCWDRAKVFERLVYVANTYAPEGAVFHLQVGRLKCELPLP